MKRLRRLDLQVKVILVLIAVIIPIYLLVVFIENRITMPILEQEVRQIGINAAKSLSSQIENRRLLSDANPNAKVEVLLQELFFWQPNIILVDVIQKEERNNNWHIVGSTVDRVESSDPIESGLFPVGHSITSEMKQSGEEWYWEIIAPIYPRSHSNETLPLGGVRLHVSLKTIHDVSAAFLKISTSAAVLNVIILIIVLSYFLRRTIANDRRLRQAESQNLALTGQLQDMQRELMNNEKLAVMGQLTASFAHEIGTPLNAIGGHLQLLFAEAEKNPALHKRQEVIQSQLTKIEDIVKSFLQNTAKPISQHQLVDINRIIQRTISIAHPRLDAENISLELELDSGLGPIRAVPLEIEQILLNLINNSIDSLRTKKQTQNFQGEIKITSSSAHDPQGNTIEIEIWDNGQGIRKENLKKVFQPFFTTKKYGEGTGLGLTICKQLAEKYSGKLEIEAKDGSWTKVVLAIPQQS